MNTAYPFIPVSIVVIVAYFVTWLFSKWKIFKTDTHRRFWNVLLLITFLISGILGIISVIKINYKIEIPNYDNLLKWHVSFGIGMVLISFFHFSWHIKYYLRLLKKKLETQTKNSLIESKSEETRKFSYLLVLLGSLIIITQVVFIREFLSVTSGNELVLGIIMANWLMITAWGAFSGRKQTGEAVKINKAINMLSVYSLFPLLIILLLYWLKDLLFPPGTLPDVAATTIGAFLLLFPVCFLSGFLFTTFTTSFSGLAGKEKIGEAYALESFGSLTGGLIFSFLLGRFFNSFEILGLSGGVVFLLSVLFLEKKLNKILFLFTGLLLPVFIFISNPDTRIKKVLFPNQEILLNKSTPYGNLVVTEQAGQLNFYENNSLQFYTGSIMQNEEAVHFTMVQHKNPKNILLISGGISGMTEEILKYKVDKITYLETNPEIYRQWKEFTHGENNYNQVEFIKSDIRTFLKKTSEIYDVVMMNLPPPSSLGYNRFYTEEFIKSVKNHCNSESVISISLPSSANYTEKNALDMNASLWKTLGKNFENQLLLTGEKNYFLASGNSLSHEIIKLINEIGISNEYVNEYYFDDVFLTQRSNTLVSQFDNEVNINRDFHPFMFIKQTHHWLSHFGTSFYILIIIPSILFFLFFFKQSKISAGLYIGGFSAASLEIILMLAYQIYFGSIYLATALFFAFFMGGLATGSLTKQKAGILKHLKRYYILQFVIAAFAILLPLLIKGTGLISGYRIIAQIIFFILVFVLAFFVGHEYYLAAELQPFSVSETTGINYSTDLAGSAFGAFLTAIVLLPLLGLIYSCLIIASLNILSGLMAVSVGKYFKG